MQEAPTNKNIQTQAATLLTIGTLSSPREAELKNPGKDRQYLQQVSPWIIHGQVLRFVSLCFKKKKSIYISVYLIFT
jgi:hypothetical protein